MRALPEDFTIKEAGQSGLGLFAKRDIVIFPAAITHIHHPFIGWLRTAVGAFINHSTTPNCTVQENKITVSAQTAIKGFNLDRYLLGSRYNDSDGIVIRVRYLLQHRLIKKGEELTIEYEDVLYHGIRPIDYPRFPASKEEEGQTTEEQLELVG